MYLQGIHVSFLDPYFPGNNLLGTTKMLLVMLDSTKLLESHF